MSGGDASCTSGGPAEAGDPSRVVLADRKVHIHRVSIADAIGTVLQHPLLAAARADLLRADLGLDGVRDAIGTLVTLQTLIALRATLADVANVTLGATLTDIALRAGGRSGHRTGLPGRRILQAPSQGEWARAKRASLLRVLRRQGGDQCPAPSDGRSACSRRQ